MAADGPRLGFYIGTKRDYSCPGDHATWEIVLMEGDQCTIDCRSELSLSKGGLQAWHVEGTWEVDDDEVTITITQDDPLGGPKRDRDIVLPLSEDNSSLKFRDVDCAWAKPPRDPIAERMDGMGLKDLKIAVVASGLDPDGCIERGDFLRLLGRARVSGTLRLDPPSEPSASPASSPSKASPQKASLAASPAPSAPSVSPAPSASPVTPKRDVAAAPAPASGYPAGAGATPAAAAKPAAQTAQAAEPPAQADETPKEGQYTLEQLTDKRTWEKLDVKPTERETYLPDAVFQRLFAMSKEDFAKLPKWKKDNAKKKHDLF